MISDQEIINLITTRTRGGQIMVFNKQDKTQYVVDDKHNWDFNDNTYIITKRFAQNGEVTKEKK